MRTLLTPLNIYEKIIWDLITELFFMLLDFIHFLFRVLSLRYQYYSLFIICNKHTLLFSLLTLCIMYIFHCIVLYILVQYVTHVKYISWTARRDLAVTFPASLISRYVLCCALFVFVYFVYSYVCCIIAIFVFFCRFFCRFFCLLTIQMFSPTQKK